MIMAGRMRHRISILKRDSGADEYGEEKTTFTTIISGLPCEVRKVEGTQDGEASTSTTVRLKIRMRPRDIANDLMVEFNGNRYEVEYVDPLINNREQFVHCVGEE